MHLFIAFEIPEPTKSLLMEKQQELHACMPVGLRYMPQENMHMTLLFLGKVPESCVPEIIVSLEEFFQQFVERNKQALQTQLVAQLSTIELNSEINPRVVWCRLLVADLIDDIRYNLCTYLNNKIAACTGKNFCSRRPFLPHITLGRIKKVELLSELTTCLLVERELHQEFFLSTVTLRKSLLTTGSAVYTSLWSKKLIE